MQIYGGRDPRALPAYTVREAAHYVRVPESTLRSWVHGRPYPIAAGTARFEPVIRLSDPSSRLLSFTNLVEAHVLAGARRDHKVALENIRSAIEYVRQRMGVDRPLAHADFETNGVDLFVSHMGQLVNVSRQGQVEMRQVIEAHLERIERDEQGLAVRLFLFTRTGVLTQPRLVVVDPLLEFGRPVLAGTGVPTAMLAERYLAGESIGELAEDYACDALMVEEAIRCELHEAA